MFTIAVVVLWVILAVAHSVLGESAVLRPLFAAAWDIGMPRGAAERLLRFAWHLTSIAWLGLAVAAAGVPLLIATAAVAFASAVVIFVMLRGHLAWPLLLALAWSALLAADALPRAACGGIAIAAAGLALAITAIHLYWAAGGRRGFARALPQRSDGRPVFEPGALPCVLVALACAGLAALLVWPLLARPPTAAALALAIAWVLLMLRAIGDGRQVGFSKRDRSTPFAQSDDAVFTPLVVGLIAGCANALVLAFT